MCSLFNDLMSLAQDWLHYHHNFLRTSRTEMAKQSMSLYIQIIMMITFVRYSVLPSVWHQSDSYCSIWVILGPLSAPWDASVGTHFLLSTTELYCCRLERHAWTSLTKNQCKYVGWVLLYESMFMQLSCDLRRVFPKWVTVCNKSGVEKRFVSDNSATWHNYSIVDWCAFWAVCTCFDTCVSATNSTGGNV